METAEECVGRERKKARSTLQPILEAKRQAHQRVLHTNTIANRREYRKHQRIVKHAVDCAKESWILRIAHEAERAKKDGRQSWLSIQQLQMGYA